ncbi:DNA polymerase III subunit chi [Corticibacter populi]|uniref:DNA polymerase III subunit chi n=1 Tax=Corticibacter populi TaxID=1550736 RepID=A0A3M6QZ24_9BURK|nr:DNA polymerase III subunit chi [Corticibacter populi]RMX08274.1 DNA polymerase III subunit chi [Corticibacter populi]RZS35553.1 DNA polymerase III chi subunit [Corticibacter populi]
MTDVLFYFNVPSKLHFACRLARKAFTQGSGLVITAPVEQLQDIDGLLWNMAPSDFIAHDWLRADAALQAAAGPIQLLESPEAAPLVAKPQALLSLWPEVPSCFSHFEQVYEMVAAADDADRQMGRQRWRYYQQRGYRIEGHDLAQTSL